MSAPQGVPIPPAIQAALESAVHHLFINRYYSLAATVMLVYDTILTFDREVETIWKSNWTTVKFLFFFNRYANIGAYVISWVAVNSGWPAAVCSRYVLFPGIFNIVQQMVIGAILILFTWALFERSNLILAIVCGTYVAQIVLIAWSTAATTAVILPPMFSACIFSGKKGTGIRRIIVWIVQLAFISVVFGLMIWKSLKLQKAQIKAPLIEIVTRDGLKYFGVIFTANLINVLNFVLLKPLDLRSVHATFSALITVVMINRLVLSIREEANRPRTSGLNGQKLLGTTVRDALYVQNESSAFQESWHVARPNHEESLELSPKRPSR